MSELSTFHWIGIFIASIHLLGMLSAINAIVQTRTSQGATAWAISLISFPYLALPLYWVFGQNKFRGYVRARRIDEAQVRELVNELSKDADAFRYVSPHIPDPYGVVEKLAKMPFTTGNTAELLVDGDATFGAIFEAIRVARQYVLAQFFIIRDDQVGNEFINLLTEKAQQGVRVHLLYDEIGCHKLSRHFFKRLVEAGAHVSAFKNKKGIKNRFQINFRNHRKIVVVDGEVGFVGGLNVGDEYMGRSPRFGHWRDTHVRMRGPVVIAAQLSFLEDWYWARHDVPVLNWHLRGCDPCLTTAIAVPTGPADTLETCALLFTQLIHNAKKRVWIASPYFVPDGQTLAALQLAALRGVDVRVLLPEKPDHLIVYLAAFSYLPQTESVGAKVYRYQAGFMHHKVILIDDDTASVGTANFDNRSFRLNFEITMLFRDQTFAKEVETMLERDFSQSRLVNTDDLRKRSIPFRIAVRIARLMSPVL